MSDTSRFWQEIVPSPVGVNKAVICHREGRGTDGRPMIPKTPSVTGRQKKPDLLAQV
jgi:hypothetical protein